jgi:hypothetical protein
LASSSYYTNHPNGNGVNGSPSAHSPASDVDAEGEDEPADAQPQPQPAPVDDQEDPSDAEEGSDSEYVDNDASDSDGVFCLLASPGVVTTCVYFAFEEVRAVCEFGDE